MELNKVFVYGTLKSGYGNNRLLHQESLVTPGITTRHFYLVDVGFPFAISEKVAGNRGVLPVRGEVWTLSNELTLARLDSLEGVSPNGGGMYDREQEIIIDDRGEEHFCYMYVRNNAPYRMETVCPIIDSCYEWSR